MTPTTSPVADPPGTAGAPPFVPSPGRRPGWRRSRLDAAAARRPHHGTPAHYRPITKWHGWVIAALIAFVAYAAQYLPFAPFRIVLESGAVRHPVGPAIIAILLGVVLRNFIRLPESVTAGGRSLVKWSIPWAIVLIGAGLNLGVMAGIGLRSFGIVIGTILIAVAAAIVAGRFLRLHRRMSLLLAAGTAICGNSAILAVAPIIKARDKQMLISIGVVNMIGLAFMMLLPALGMMLAMSPEAMGVWAGASIHSVPQAVAAGFAYPEQGAGEVATLIKLVRVAMLVPLVIAFTLIVANGNGTLRSVTLRSLVPWFIWGFLALAAVNTFVHGTGALPAHVADAMKSSMSWLNLAGGILLTVALAAIGMDVDLRKLAQVGKRALLAGLIASVVMAAGCLAMIAMLL